MKKSIGMWLLFITNENMRINYECYIMYIKYKNNYKL